MAEQTFGARFGELRSALAGEPSQQAFEAVLGILSSMRRQDGARFEAEVLPYAGAALDRWYAGAGELHYALGGRLVVPALKADASWLEVVRRINLADEHKAREAIDALLGCTRLGRLREVALPQRLSGHQLREVAEARLMDQLEGLEVMSAKVSDPLSAWRAQPPPNLKALSLTFCELEPQALEAVSGVEAQLERLSLRYSRIDAGAWARLLDQGRWDRLRELSWPDRHAYGCSEQELRALVGLTGRCALERLDVSGLGPSSQRDALWSAPGLSTLKQLSAESVYRGAGIELDLLLSGAACQRLERLSLRGVGLRGGEMALGGERLEEVELNDVEPGALRWFLAQRLPALRALSLGSRLDWEMAERLCEAMPERLRKLALSGRDELLEREVWERLWRRVSALEGLETLWLFISHVALEAWHVDVMLEACAQMPAIRSIYMTQELWTEPLREQVAGTRLGEALERGGV